MKHSLFWLLDQYPETGESVAEVHQTALEHAEQADRLGFDSLWIAEHHFETLGTAPNPAILLAAMAQRTRTIRLGPAVSVLPLHDPIRVAEDYALVDELSGGRLNMGVGSGSRADEFEPFGVDFERRRELFAENLATIRERWKRAAAGETGPGSLNVAPRQSSPPIYVATQSEESAYRVGLFGTPASVGEQLRRVADHGIGHVAFISRFGGMVGDVAVGSLRMLAPDALSS